MANKNECIVSFSESMSGRTVGGKFEKQKVMLENGIPVPRFFCLTNKFYDKVFTQIKGNVEALLKSINYEDSASVRAASMQIEALFCQCVIDEHDLKVIEQHFNSLFSETTFVSVRSSMIGKKLEESEDSLDNPFAGISESFLYVTKKQLAEKIKYCWASGFSQEAILYRYNQGMDLLGFSVAVGIQEMVFGNKSFVMFTCDPNTASKNTIIIAGHGIGEGVVQEKVPVDHYFKNGTSGVITSKISEKTHKLTFDNKKGSGLMEAPVSDSDKNSACLSDSQINTLAEYGKKIEKIFSHPQDIEGTFTESGELFFLQSRPIALDYSRQRVWTNANVTESFPGVTTALTFSFARYFYRVIFYDCYRLFAYDNGLLHDNHEPLDKMIGFLKGRVYYNLTSFYHLHSLTPLFPVLKKSWENMMGFQASYQTKPSSFYARILDKFKVMGKITLGITNVTYRYLTHQRDIKKFHKWWEGLISPLRGKSFETMDLIQVENTFYKVWGEVANNWGVTLTNDTYLPVLYALAESIFKKWQLDDDKALLSDLLCGGENLLSVDIILSAVNLAEIVRKNPELAKAFAENTAMTLWQQLDTGKLEPKFTEKVKEHLHLYGDRGLQELKMEQPNTRHEPWILLKMVQEYVKSDITVELFKTKEKEVRLKAEERLKQKLGNNVFKKSFLNWLLNSIRRLIRNRENSRYCRSELYGFSKNIFRGIGVQFQKDGVLNAADDIMHLSMEEVFGYIDGTGVTENLQKLADLRREEFIENQKVETPIQLTTIGAVRKNSLTLPHIELGSEKTLVGLGSSTGKVRGTAKVVLDPTKPLDISDDMILVARETDPGWLFLMLASKGLVVERGSMLSHTAITGRKFGIPTIVSLPNATTLIPDGAKIEIDGASGLVTLLD